MKWIKVKELSAPLKKTPAKITYQETTFLGQISSSDGIVFYAEWIGGGGVKFHHTDLMADCVEYIDESESSAPTPIDPRTDFWVECDACKLVYKNHTGSTPCCGSTAHEVDAPQRKMRSIIETVDMPEFEESVASMSEEAKARVDARMEAAHTASKEGQRSAEEVLSTFHVLGKLNQHGLTKTVTAAMEEFASQPNIVPENLCVNCADPYDHHDGGKVNCHPQYIEGFNDGAKSGSKTSEKLIEVQKEYIALLGEELDDAVSQAAVHGWQSHRVEEGENLRKEILKAESDFYVNASQGKGKEVVRDGIHDGRDPQSLYTYYEVELVNMPVDWDTTICEDLDEVRGILQYVDIHLDEEFSDDARRQVIVTGIPMTPEAFLQWAQENYPEKYESMVTESESPYFAAPSGEKPSIEREWKRGNEVIPPITHAFGKYWEQPDTANFLINDKEVQITDEDFKKLHEYSTSNPTGAYEGKCWKSEEYRLGEGGRYIPTGKWFLKWFDVTDNPEMLSTKVRERIQPII